MNSIQYQCSFGESTNKYRDHIWLSLWFNENMCEDFANRLVRYKPNVIYNFSTKGNHTKEKLDASIPLTRINGKYIKYCAPSYNGSEEVTTLREIITASILQIHPNCEFYEGSHPASWISRKDSTYDHIMPTRISIK